MSLYLIHPCLILTLKCAITNLITWCTHSGFTPCRVLDVRPLREVRPPSCRLSGRGGRHPTLASGLSGLVASASNCWASRWPDCLDEWNHSAAFNEGKILGAKLDPGLAYDRILYLYLFQWIICIAVHTYLICTISLRQYFRFISLNKSGLLTTVVTFTWKTFVYTKEADYKVPIKLCMVKQLFRFIKTYVL